LMETSFKRDIPIKHLTIVEYFHTIIEQIVLTQPSIFGDDLEDITKFLEKKWDIFEAFERKLWELLESRLDLEATIEGHKLWNILMANIAEHVGSFDGMMEIMHRFLKVPARILPVTTHRAIIQATLDNGDIIKTQDAISNIADYSGKIVALDLCPDSQHAHCSQEVQTQLEEADYIIIAPGDLYTSTIANCIIWWVQKSIKSSKAQILFIANNTNKWGETFGYTLEDFVMEIQRYLERNIDILVVNDREVALSFHEMELLKSNISVKWGDYIYLKKSEKEVFKKQGIKIIEADLIDKETLYKHDRKEIGRILKHIILSE
jgi:uncharacterized cofD-like protein